MNAPIQAFVLKCPECGAPQPGTTSTCAYCKVPLMWAPTRRFGSDDHGLYDVEDEPGTELMYFGPQAIKASTTQVFQMQPEKIVRPRFLWVHPRCAEWVHISNIRLGIDVICEASPSNGISGSLFCRGRGFPLDVEAVVPGILINFHVRNSSTHPIVFEGALRVMPFKDMPIRNPHLRERIPGEWGPALVDPMRKR